MLTLRVENSTCKDTLLSNLFQMNDHQQGIFATDATNHFEQPNNNWENDSNFDIQEYILAADDFNIDDQADNQSPVENNDLKKQQILDYNRSYFNHGDGGFEDFDHQYHPHGDYPAADGYYHTDSGFNNMQVPTTSVDNYVDNGRVPFVPHHPIAVKAEPRYDDDAYHGVPNGNPLNTSLNSSYGSYSDGRVSVMSNVSGLNPEAIQKRVKQASSKPPRKYHLKAAEEKANPVYKQKRAKNNDAVRRSRIKAKAIAQEKEQHLQNLEDRIRALENQVRQYETHCKCNAVHRLFKQEL